MSSDLAPLIAAFAPSDPAFITDPYPALAALREATPVFENPASNQWMVTRFDDVHRLLRDKRLGRMYRHLYTDDEFGRSTGGAAHDEWPAFEASERYSLLNLEPPDHTRLRALVSKVFTPSAIRSLDPMLEATSSRLVDECAERGTFELLRDYAMPYSITVICSMLGVPTTDATQLLAWSHAIVKMYELGTTHEQKQSADDAARDFIAYIEDVIAAKRANPDGSLISELVQVEEAGERLTQDEIVCTTIVLLNAGHEATVNVHGNGMRAFMLHPAEWDRVRGGEVGTRAAVEEMMRWDAPLQMFERWVLDRDGIEVGGTVIPFGAEIAMLFGSAQRDPARFPDPERFDASRGDAGHIGFGGGLHFCIGAPLARAEIDTSLRQFIRRFASIELAAEPLYAPTFVLRGLTGLRLTVSPA